MSIQLGNPIAQSEPVQHIPHSLTNPQPTSRSPQEPLLQLPQVAPGVAHKKEAVTMDWG